MPAVGSLRLLLLDFHEVPCGVQCFFFVFFNLLHACKLKTNEVCLHQNSL